MVDKYNFNVVPNDEQEEFTVDFGETIKVVENDFNQLENRPSYAGTTMTGDTNIPEVPTAVSQLQNDADYQTGSEVSSAINAHDQDEEAHPYIQGIIDTKQDALTAGTNIQISEQNVISATDTTYSAGNGINISGQNAISVDTTIVATQQNLSDEVTNRENADIALQAQIDGISASSDVVDIVGTYAELQQYDTQHLKDNDIIKVLQDETQGGATTYYRWSTSTSTFTLIGQEGPYYTKAAADSQFVPQTRTVNGKALSSNITLNASDVSALGTSDVVQTTGSSTSQVMSQNAVTTQLNTKLNASDYVVDTQLADSSNPVQNRVINNLLGNMPADFFTAGETVSGEGTDITLNNTISAPLESVELDGDTYQQTYSGKNLMPLSSVSVDNNTRETKFKIDLPAGTYTISFDIDSFSLGTNTSFGVSMSFVNSSNVQFADRTIITVNSSTTLGRKTYNLTITDDASSAYDSNIRVPLTQYNNGARVEISNIQIEEGSSPTAYEPYVGGTASPNPDYPQDVQVVTGEQTVEVNNNIWSSSLEQGGIASGTGIAQGTASNRVRTTDYTSAIPNNQYTISSTTQSLQVVVFAYDSSNTYLGTLNAGDAFIDLPYTFTTTSNVKYLKFSFRLSNNNDISPSGVTGLNLASQTQFYTVDLGSIELCKIGDYQDYIYKSGDDWYVHKEFSNVALPINDMNNNDDYPGWTAISETLKMKTDAEVSGSSNPGNVYNIYNYSYITNIKGLVSSSSDNNVSVNFNGSNSLVYLPKNIYGLSQTQWKSQYAGLTVKLYYKPKTPTDTKITDATLMGQLEALYNAKTNLGTTSIVTTATGTNLPVILDIVAYRKSLAGMLGAIERLSE